MRRKFDRHCTMISRTMVLIIFCCVQFFLPGALAEDLRLKAVSQLLRTIVPAIEPYAADHPDVKLKVAARLFLCAVLYRVQEDGLKRAEPDEVMKLELLRVAAESYQQVSSLLIENLDEFLALTAKDHNKYTAMKEDDPKFFSLLRNCQDFSDENRAAMAVFEVVSD